MKELEMINGICTERDCLTCKQQEALARMLKSQNENGTDEFTHAVDFLWLADEIDLNTRCDLLDLV